MAAQYIDDEYCYERFGEDLTEALTTRLGGSLVSVIESATSYVRMCVAQHGFTAPNTDPDATTSELLKSATFAALWQALAQMPKASVKLPEGWDSNPYRKQLAALEEENSPASKALLEAEGLSLDTATSVGGSLWVDVTEDGDDPRRTTSDELAGY